MYIPYIHTGSSITAIIDRPHSIDISHPNYDTVVNLLTTSTAYSTDQILELMQPVREFKKAIASSEFYHNAIHQVCIDIDGFPFPLATELEAEVLRIYRSNGDLAPLAAFVRKLAANPDKDVHKQLYSFIQVCKLALTVDGDFLAYKNVRNDFLDIYSGTMDNSPGNTVEMPRFAVEKNPNRTCSAGLHFAAWGYLRHYTYGSDTRTVIVKINPADVVSIPSDYNNMKGRASKYYILKEIDRPSELDHTPVYHYDNDDEEFDEEFEEDYEEDYEDAYCDSCDELLDDCNCDSTPQDQVEQAAQELANEINSTLAAMGVPTRIKISLT